MKCVCGYVDCYREREEIFQDKPFLKYSFIYRVDFNSNASDSTTVYVCPSCGTLKVNIDSL